MHKIHRYFLNTLLFLTLPVTFLKFNVNNIDFFSDKSHLSWIVVYLQSAISLSVFYYGVYSYLCNEMQKKEVKMSVVTIAIGGVLIATSYIPPVVSLALIDGNSTDDTSMGLEELASYSTNTNVMFKERVISARRYYIVTGDSIDYLDANNRRKVFTPKDDDQEERYRYLYRERKIKSIIAKLKDSILINFVVMIIVSIFFIPLIFFRFRRMRNGVTH